MDPKKGRRRSGILRHRDGTTLEVYSATSRRTTLWRDGECVEDSFDRGDDRGRGAVGIPKPESTPATA